MKQEGGLNRQGQTVLDGVLPGMEPELPPANFPDRPEMPESSQPERSERGKLADSLLEGLKQGCSESASVRDGYSEKDQKIRLQFRAPRAFRESDSEDLDPFYGKIEKGDSRIISTFYIGFFHYHYEKRDREATRLPMKVFVRKWCFQNGFEFTREDFLEQLKSDWAPGDFVVTDPKNGQKYTVWFDVSEVGVAMGLADWEEEVEGERGMNTIFLYQLLFACFLLSLISTVGWYVLALKRRLLPAIRSRDVHTIRKPRIGGLAMWGVVFIVIIWLANSPYSGWLNFGTVLVLGMQRAVWGILLGMLIILIFGLLDDIRGLSPGWQLAGQLLTALALVFTGVGVTYLRLPLGHVVSLDQAVWHLPAWLGGNLYLWSAIFTMVWVVALINVMNFFDGLDGLAGSVAFTAALVLLFVSLRLQIGATAVLSVILAGSVAGFLPFNWYPSRIFMGTVGSQLLGFLLAIIAIISGGKVATAVLVLGIPLLDAFMVIFRRLWAGKSPFQADQRHLHHRLLKLGISVPGVVILINSVAVIFGVLAVRSQETNQKGLLTLGVIAAMAFLIFMTYYLEKRASSRVRP